MTPLVPALVLAFVSFLASAFVVLRIVIPILPPSPLSRRVSPSEFGLPAFRSLSPADKSHLWLAGFDLFALTIFVWHVLSEATSGPTGVAIASDPLSAVRLWLFMTTRQGCLLVVAAITLLHVRMGRSINYGKTHWMLWAPVVLLAVTSTALAGVMSGAGVNSLFVGLSAYSGSIALITTAVMSGIFATLYAIKRNLAALNEEDEEPWPPVREVEAKSRPSFGTEEIDAIKDGESWITSHAGSRRNSVSAWSFSTHHTAVGHSAHGHGGRPQNAHSGSIPAKSSFWFSAAKSNELVPPVPPLPSQFGTSDTLSAGDPDPFRRENPHEMRNQYRARLGSQNSWMTSTGSHTTVTAWSFPATKSAASVYSADFQTAVHSRPATPALATAQVLGGYGFNTSEEGLNSLAAPAGADVDISVHPIIGWFISVWLPLAFSFPYLITLAQQGTPSTAIYVLYVLSVTLSAPLLALNILFKSPLPIPTGLFERDSSSINGITGTSGTKRLSTTPSELPAPYKWSHEYKRSMSSSPTVVEGRRSCDVWITNGDAVDGKSKLSRAMSMLTPQPKLSVIPPEEIHTESPPLPPVPIPDEDSLPINIYTHGRSQSESSAQFGKIGTKSTRYSKSIDVESNPTKIMIAQRHYSHLAQTVVVSPGASSEKLNDSPVGNATGVVVHKPGAHLRTRSISSAVPSGPQTPTGSSFGTSDVSGPPPPFPLPPTPPNVRAARLAGMSHKKSFSSSYSFGPVEDMNEIDALTAGVLPILVPGLTVGDEMKIKDGGYSPPGTFSKSKGRKVAKNLKMKEFGDDFSSPEVHSTPAAGRKPRNRKASHKKNHFSLPSLGLGKEGLQSLSNWSSEIRGALEHRVGQYMAVPSNVDVGYRNTVFGGESIPNNIPGSADVNHQTITGANLARGLSKRSMGLRADVPVSARSSARNSMVVPPSAASTVTLFEEFEAELESNPDAHHSTPHQSVAGKQKRSRSPAPALPPKRRSSIVYIRSDEDAAGTSTTTYMASTSENVGPQGQSARASITQWSARAVRPLIPKTSLKKLRAKTSSERSEKGSEQGLRQLTLLQDRDTNSIHSTSSQESTRPLSLGKKQKTRKMTVSASSNDENASIREEEAESADVVGSLRGIKPLKLVRSETSKQRAILRKNEVLPTVMVRPPSMTEHTPFAYAFSPNQ